MHFKGCTVHLDEDKTGLTPSIPFSLTLCLLLFLSHSLSLSFSLWLYLVLTPSFSVFSQNTLSNLTLFFSQSFSVFHSIPLSLTCFSLSFCCSVSFCLCFYLSFFLPLVCIWVFSLSLSIPTISQCLSLDPSLCLCVVCVLSSLFLFLSV